MEDLLLSILTRTNRTGNSSMMNAVGSKLAILIKLSTKIVWMFELFTTELKIPKTTHAYNELLWNPKLFDFLKMLFLAFSSFLILLPWGVLSSSLSVSFFFSLYSLYIKYFKKNKFLLFLQKEYFLFRVWLKRLVGPPGKKDLIKSSHML